jgi:tetratricopeptide (TPR) repeat protein
MNVQVLQSRWWRMCLPAATLTALLVGCSMPGKNAQQVTTAGYQQLVVDEGPPRKIKDPLSLKLRYARWMEEIENYDEAQANYQIVLQERPKEIEAILGLARIDQAAGRMQAAEEGYNKALSLQPNSAIAKNALGQFYAAQGRMSDALPLLSDAMMGEPTNKVFRFHFAVALAKTGDATAALPHFVQAVGEPTAYYNVGMILKSQGRYAQAEEHLLQAVNKKPDFEAAKQALTQVRQQTRAAGTYASTPQRAPQIQPAGHSRPATITPQQSRHQASPGR